MKISGKQRGLGSQPELMYRTTEAVNINKPAIQGNVAAKSFLAKSIRSVKDESPERGSARGQAALQGSQGRQQRRRIVIPLSHSKSPPMTIIPVQEAPRKLSPEKLEH